MDINSIYSEEVQKISLDELFKELDSNIEGLNSAKAISRLEKYGYNVIEEKKKSFLLKFLHYFWGPIPWMIEIAAILSIIARHFADLTIILILLFVNGLVKFWEEFQASNAIAALKKKLALKSIVKRDGAWIEIDSSLLVPGDVIRLRLGTIIPADALLFEGDYLTVDQSTITGESLPVVKKRGDLIFSGSISKQGEMCAVVITTGKNTFFGKTIKLVEKAKPISHFQKAVIQIGDYLIYISAILASVLITVQLIRGTPLLELIQFVLILLIASIPVAMPAVLSITMALGALKLSKMKALVTKLESIEEIAGIDILCCDKTGTLTQNQIKLGDPFAIKPIEKQEVIFYAALASKAENQDPIDLAIIGALKNPEQLKLYTIEKFDPFNPIKKKIDVTIRDKKGNIFYITKGAPQVIIEICNLEESLKKQVNKTIDDFAEKGHRSLAVARSTDGKTWQFLGLLPLFDPIRADSVETIKRAQEYGIKIKMVTGDNVAIAKEIANQLNIGSNIKNAEELIEKEKNSSPDEVIQTIENCDGFAQIFPEHKFMIVKALQNKNHIVGMTGDGVNDSPALKQADVGIAVSGATDAARASASLVLLESGLSTIIKAIEESRRIFERMNSYCIYRISETLRVMLFITSSILAFNFYPVNAIMIILIALLNDIPILSIAYDNTLPQSKPVKWQMKKILILATTLACIGIVSSFTLLFIAKKILLLSLPQIQSFIFLKLSLAGHQTLFIARTKNRFYKKPYPAPILLLAILTTQFIAALFVGFGWLLTPIPWTYIGLIWGYTLIWMFFADSIKVLLHRRFNRTLITQ